MIILFTTLGASLLVSSSDLISMYLSIELQSFAVYILATLYRESEAATSAGLKYFLLGGLSSCLILLGAGLVYSYTGLTNLESIYSLLGVSIYSHTSEQLISQGLLLGFTLIFVGFLFKIAAAPLHNWAPDVYDDSPTIVTIWLTVMPKIAILIFLLELFSGLSSSNASLQYIELLGSGVTGTEDVITGGNLLGEKGLEGVLLSLSTSQGLQNLLLLSSLLSLLIGTIVGLAQTRIKRLLAYSTISHVGFLLLALSVNTEQSIETFIFYIIQYTLTNLNIFLILIAFSYLIKGTSSTLISPIPAQSVLVDQSPVPTLPVQEGDNKHPDVGVIGEEKELDRDILFISELKGQFFSNPLLSISLAICLFLMAGIPPLMGFFGKQMVLYTAIQSGYYFMSIVAIIVSVISASYYLKIIKTLFFTNDSHSISHPAKDHESLPVLEGHVNVAGTEHGGQEIKPDLKEKSIFKGESIYSICTNSHSFIISVLTLTLLLYILYPSLLLNSTQLLSLTLFSSF